MLSAFLIGQIGKNYESIYNTVSGDALMDAIFSILENVQHQIGGGVVYLECEDHPKLLQFYQSEENRFQIFGKRKTVRGDAQYLQLLKMF